MSNVSASRVVVMNRTGKPVKYSDSGMRIPPGAVMQLDNDGLVAEAIEKGLLSVVAVAPQAVVAPEPAPEPEPVTEPETTEVVEETEPQEEVEDLGSETETGESTSSSKKKISSRSKES